MPTRTKEINEENNEKTTKKKAAAKKTTKAVAKKTTTKKTTTAKKSTENPIASAIKKVAAKKSTAKKATTKTKKSAVAKKASTTKKKTTTVKKATTKKASSTSKKVTAKTVKPVAQVVEYYDLPYRYNETIVKVLYQTPETLFVYWDIADSDRENYIKQYGENFFNITRPVLIIHNETMNYSFEIPINDFANSWYFNINDSKCHYRVELGRRPNYYSQEAAKEIAENIKTDYIYVTSSNKIESPNDRVLFNTNENNTIRFRNVKNNEEKSISLYDVIKHLPVMKKFENIPYISEDLLKNLYAGIYQNEDISLFERLSNPSSGGNPSSGSMSSRFM